MIINAQFANLTLGMPIQIVAMTVETAWKQTYKAELTKEDTYTARTKQLPDPSS